MSPRNPIIGLKRHHSDIIKDATSNHHTLKHLLLGLSRLYGFIVRSRVRLYDSGVMKAKRLPCLVVSVGNITVGGTGKTPFTIHLAAELNAMGFRVAILSRGYKGGFEKHGGIVSDGHSLLLEPHQAGDEPYLMASLLTGVPVVVGADRYTSGCLAIERFHPDLILLDDGFQHIQLHRDLNLLLLDTRKPLGNGHLLPRGPLREPKNTYQRADALIFTRSEDDADIHKHHKPWFTGHHPYFHCSHHPVLRCMIPQGQAGSPIQLSHGVVQKPGPDIPSPVYAFAGLARNDTFWKTLTDMGLEIAGKMDFDDHHTYAQSDLKKIASAAGRSESKCLITTDKDYVRLPTGNRFPKDLWVLGVDIEFHQDKAAWQQYLRRWTASIAKP